MTNVIRVDFSNRTAASGAIDISSLKENNRKLRSGIIAPAASEVHIDVVTEHKAEPIKSMEDILRISKYLIDNKRYRDNMLFIVGINFGLRVSDLRTLRFSQLINEHFAFRQSFPILEKKTSNTRKTKRNRYITINNAVVEAVTLYLENTPGVRLDDYLFRSESVNATGNEPIHRNSIDRILKGIAEELGIGAKVSTHTLRKTFGYHQMVMSGNDPRKLLLLQKIFGHSSSGQTLDYIGITSEEIDEAYRKLNLGSTTCNYLLDSNLYEAEAVVAQ